MKKWDYKVESFIIEATLERRLKELGEDGWELIYFRKKYATIYKAIFKREID